MTTTKDTASTPKLVGERADLLQALRQARFFLRYTAQGLTDDQARLRSTASELTIGAIVKHVTDGEERWVRFMLGQPGGPQGVGPEGPSAQTIAEWQESMQMRADETLAALLDRYEAVAAVTDDAIASVPDLDVSHPLPPAPWFERGARWSARMVLLHVIAETAQHSGHADIIRETIDGQKSMG
jgi:uncharacterized damage-inducible protein DinB